MTTGGPRGAVLRFFIVAGVVLVVVGLILVASGSEGGRFAGVIVGVSGLTWLAAWAVVSSWYGRVARRIAAAKQLFQTGTLATAVIEHVEQTGIAVNHMLTFAVRVRVEPVNGAPFTHETRLITMGTGVPLPGHLVEVGYDPSDTSLVAFETYEGLAMPPGEVWVMRPPTDDRL